jgi:ATP-dependent Lon protease
MRLIKYGTDFRGDPSSALLEVLDPEQNNTFYDNYLELEYDLSKVLFIATANNIQNIQPALRDRLEIIDLSGYAVEEKIQIAQRHLVPKEKEAHGFKQV